MLLFCLKAAIIIIWSTILAVLLHRARHPLPISPRYDTVNMNDDENAERQLRSALSRLPPRHTLVLRVSSEAAARRPIKYLLSSLQRRNPAIITKTLPVPPRDEYDTIKIIC
ncbi:MAG: hypothetical protein Q4B48_08170 [Syntrophomonadaceae bacterium]|nr:hypothetical protein [Syntrophomonadaceae bacterium]